MKQIESNKLIARFMGYKYYHPGVDIDYSECGGIYTRHEVFSKVPIEVDEFEHECHFKSVPKSINYNNSKNVKDWAISEYVDWNRLNYDNYKIDADLDYKNSWNLLMPVGEKIKNLYDKKNWHLNEEMDNLYTVFKYALHSFNIQFFYKSIITILKRYMIDYSKYIGCYVKRHWAPFQKEYMHEILDWKEDYRYSQGMFKYGDGNWYDVEDSVIIVNNDIHGNEKEYRELNVNDERYIQEYYNPYK